MVIMFLPEPNNNSLYSAKEALPVVVTEEQRYAGSICSQLIHRAGARTTRIGPNQLPAGEEGAIKSKR